MTSRQRSGFFILIGLILIAELIIQFYPKSSPESSVQFTEEELDILERLEKQDLSTVKKTNPVQLFKFNPNELDKEGFMRLGFSEKQANAIIKYRYVVGGNFSSIAQFGEAYVISEKKLEQLRPYIHLKDINQKTNKNSFTNTRFKSNTKKIKPFYPNRLDLQGWINVGFSKRQAQSILNFKNALPGKRFSNELELKKAYAINDYMFNKIQPLLKWEVISESKSNAILKTTEEYNYIVNEMNTDDWVHLGFNQNTAENIIKYREFIGGFKSLADVKNCKYITNQQFEEIKDKLKFID